MKEITTIWIISLFVLFSCQQVQNENQENVHHPRDDEHTIYTMDGLEHGLIQYINKLEGNNTRHVQALFGRKIEQ